MPREEDRETCTFLGNQSQNFCGQTEAVTEKISESQSLSFEFDRKMYAEQLTRTHEMHEKKF